MSNENANAGALTAKGSCRLQAMEKYAILQRDYTVKD